MFLLTLAAAALAPASGNIQLTDELDELADGQWYCFDAFGDYIDDGDGIQVHTCKTGPTEDQDWTIDSPSLGQIESTQVSGLCVEAQRIAVGGWLDVVACQDRPGRKQLWVADLDGIIHPQYDTSLCVTVELGVHGTCGNPSCTNYKRDVTLQDCASIKQKKFLIWTIPGGTIGI